jgi:hypothetical protein
VSRRVVGCVPFRQVLNDEAPTLSTSSSLPKYFLWWSQHSPSLLYPSQQAVFGVVDSVQGNVGLLASDFDFAPPSYKRPNPLQPHPLTAVVNDARQLPAQRMVGSSKGERGSLRSPSLSWKENVRLAVAGFDAGLSRAGRTRGRRWGRGGLSRDLMEVSLQQCEEGREESSVYVLEEPLLEAVWSRVSFGQGVKDSVANSEEDHIWHPGMLRRWIWNQGSVLALRGNRRQKRRQISLQPALCCIDLL